MKLVPGDRVELLRTARVTYPEEFHTEFPAGTRGTVVKRSVMGEPLLSVAVSFDHSVYAAVLCAPDELRKLSLLEVLAEAAA